MATQRRNRKRYGVPVGSGVWVAFSAPADIYDSLATLLGLTNLGDSNAEPPQGTQLRVPVSSIPTAGRISVTYLVGAVRKTGRVYCAPGRIEEALAGLRQQTYRGNNIVEARIARRRVLV